MTVLDTRYSEAARSRAESVPLAMLAACYWAAEIVLPIVLAFVLNLVLQPGMRALERVHLSHGIAATLIILVLFSTLGRLGTAAVGTGGELGAEAAHWHSQIAGTPELELARQRIASRRLRDFLRAL